MSAKFRSPALRSVRTPEALATLRAWLGSFDERTRQRGEEYFAGDRVLEVRAAADHYVEASVAGTETYAVTLFFTRNRWSSQCTCPVGTRCKHAHAAGLAWLAHVAAGGPDGADPVAAESKASREPPLLDRPARPAPPPAAPPPQLSFRDHWSPVLVEKLGRPLTEAEALQLEQLEAVYAELVRAHGTLYPGALLRHGFDYTPPPGTPLHAPAFAGWWNSTTVPADPWALWQYIAYDYEQHGRPIPEVFRPLTETTSLHPTIATRLVQHDLAAWERALAGADEPVSTAPRHPATQAIGGLRARIRPDGSVVIETRAPGSNSWRSATQRWLASVATARPADFEHLSPPEAALGSALAAETRVGSALFGARNQLPTDVVANLFRTRGARDAFVRPDGSSFQIEPAGLLLDADVSATTAHHLDLRLATPDGRDASRAALITLRPSPLYVFENRIWRGPPPTPDTPLPKAALDDSRLMTRLRAAGLRLAPALEANIRRVTLRPLLRCWLTPATGENDAMEFKAELLARADDFPYEQRWTRSGWSWTDTGAPPPRRPADPVLEIDLSAAQAASARLAEFHVEWHQWENVWSRGVPKNFPDEFIAWHATLPPGLRVEASPGLSHLLGPPLRGRLEISAAPTTALGRDWFDLSVNLRVADTTLTAEETALLLKARGKWVHLPKRGWERLELDTTDAAGASIETALERLGLDASNVLSDGRTAVHRVHALQLATEADVLERRDARLAAALRARVQAIAAQPPPSLPAGLLATLRPYQEEGFRFLAHLSSLSLGGVLADDMGLGKTVQTLAWLLHLSQTADVRNTNIGQDARPRKFRALVVCPKSVVHGWLAETARFAPSLHAATFNPLRRGPATLGATEAPGSPRSTLNAPGSQLSTLSSEPSSASSQLLIANYAQLRINAAWFRQQTWDAVVLDEGQFIKNPGSQVAMAARALVTQHRIVLTGTPIENRLTDLWSLFAFAQPGVLGTQAAFRRHYNEANPEALTRLRRRVRHFLLRRTKAQAAPDLPPRTEDDLVVTLEGAQRRLYDAELKRARAQLLGIDTNQALSAVRFNVLSSLLRLRQICCHPALIDPAHRDLPSAKLDALLEQLEELRDEGHQVLVFSQFVEMLEIIRSRLVAAEIGHLMLTGQTENRGELVEQFQSDRSKTVFLLSLKAAGFGLNLTAASYAILYDPWWNPAVEAQAIDRTHRIGQTQPVVAYRLLAEGTVEEKIRAMQRDKAALAQAVVQEESLAAVLDLDSLRQILA